VPADAVVERLDVLEMLALACCRVVYRSLRTNSRFSVAKKLSTGALSQHWATRLSCR
jgi:hypothetical protein